MNTLSLFDDGLPPPPNDVEYLKQCLNHVTLSKTAPKIETSQTQHFYALLKSKKSLDSFIKVDEFAGRVHTPITNLIPELKQHLLLQGKQTVSLDIAMMQPLLLSKILKDALGNNEFSTLMDSGCDIYEYIQDKLKLASRKEAKNKFFEILFNPPTEDLKDMFGAADWILWINGYKSKYIAENPNSSSKPHSNLAWLLQHEEVVLMKQIWRELISRKIIFLTLHDEIICKISDVTLVTKVMNNILDKSLAFADIFQTINTPTIKERDDHYVAATGQTVTYTIHPDLEKELQSLQDYFNTIALPDTIRLNPCSMINNLPKFVHSHLDSIRFSNGNEHAIPYLERLYELKQLLQCQQTTLVES